MDLPIRCVKINVKQHKGRKRMKESKYVLAMYDVRGKQEYIFRTNKLKEIVGASCIIRDCFKDYLFPAAEVYMREKAEKNGRPLPEKAACGIYNYKDYEKSTDTGSQKGYIREIDKGQKFSQEAFCRMMQDEVYGERYAGEVIYEGGGNFFVLYKDKETCIEINKIFTRNLLKSLHSLKVLCTYIELENGFEDFKEDRRRLYAKHRINEAEESVIRPVNTLPFVQVDEVTSLPLTEFDKGTNKKVSTEVKAKLKKYLEEYNKNPEEYGEKDIDNLVTKKGEESLLAVVYIDGNNMGARVQNVLQGKTSYDECVATLRETSDFIQKNYVEDRIKAIDQTFEERLKKSQIEIEEGTIKKQKEFRRLVIFAGDEINLICNARDTYEIAKTYLRDLHQVKWKGGTEPCSACAGIAIFHSHAPYAEAYKIAEECCESGKTRMKQLEKKREEEEISKEVNYIDFHYCQSGIGMSLEDIREKEIGELISKPWLLNTKNGNKEDKLPEDITVEEIEKVAAALRLIESRTNVKNLAAAAKMSEGAFNLEMRRIYAHQSDKEIKDKLKDVFVQEKDDIELSKEEYKKYRKMIYDIVMVYDLWFRKEEEVKHGDNSK